MNQSTLIYNIRVTRSKFIELSKQLTINQINSKSPTYLNSIGWNFAHVIATQQLLTYGLHKMSYSIPQEFIDAYRKGTKSETDISKDELKIIHQYAIESVDKLEQDIKAQKFNTFNSYQTSYGVSLNSFEDVLVFLPVHEALHLGMCMARKKILI